MIHALGELVDEVTLLVSILTISMAAINIALICVAIWVARIRGELDRIADALEERT